MNFSSPLTLLPVLALSLGACSKDVQWVPATQVLVTVHSDLGSELAKIEAQVWDVAGEKRGDGFAFTLGETLRLPFSFTVVPSLPDTAQFMLVLSARAAGGVELVQSRAITTFVAGKSVGLELWLYAGCKGMACGSEQTCVALDESGALGCAAVPALGTHPVEPGQEIDTDATTLRGQRTDSGLMGPMDAGVDSSTMHDGGAISMEATVPVDASTDADLDTSADAAPAPDCDATHSCSPGFACVEQKCVSKCLQNACDPNATCSLIAGAPTCSCGSGFIEVKSGSGAVTCMRDVSCEQLACDVNAMCVLNSDQTRGCVCKPGYDGTGKTCAPVDCGPVTLPNGTANAANGVTTYGGTINYACNTGYVRSGVASATCGVNAAWSATASCNPVDCGAPTLTNGTANPATGATTLGSGVNYACNVGYTRTGAATGSCGSNGKWSGSACSIVTCSPTPTNPTGGQVSTNNGNVYGSVASYSCNGGTLQGDMTRACQSNGQWSGTEPICLYCGDGKITGSEACDPKHPSWNAWTCSTSCVKTTAYTTCTPSRGCNAGEVCYGTYMCLPGCGVTSDCPRAPSGSPATPLCGTETSGLPYCVLNGCTSNAHCAPGLICTNGSCNACIASQSNPGCDPGRTCTPTRPGVSDLGHCL